MAQKRRKRRRRRKARGGVILRFLAMICLCAALFSGAFIFFKVEEIQVQGTTRYSNDEVITISGIELSESMIFIDKGEIISALTSRLSYLKTAQVRRKLPNQIILVLTEWDAVAQVEDTENAANWIISAGGKVLENAQADVIRVTGITPIGAQAGTFLAVPVDQQDRLAALLLLFQAIEAQGDFARVSEISLSSGRIEMRYDNRFTVLIPFVCDFSYKMQALEKAIEHVNEKRSETETGVMDMTQENYPVTYRPD